MQPTSGSAFARQGKCKMLFIIKVYADEQVYEYEYGLLEHAHEHLRQEQSYTELYLYCEGCEWFIEAVNSNNWFR